MMYIDTHCHLNLKEYDDDRAMVIGNAKKAGVKKCIVPGVDLRSSQVAVDLSQQYHSVLYASVGIHPHEAQHHPDVQKLEQLFSTSNSTIQQSNNPIVAIGECGLDYHLYKGEDATSKKTNQQRLFEEQLLLAIKYNLPVIMHCRDAYEDFFNVIDRLPTRPRGVIHCFSGGLQELRFAQERQLFVGIDGNVTYSKDLWQIVPHIPLSMLLLETDSPFLTPIPYRGKRNEPKHIPTIAHKIAELQNTTVQIIAEQTTRNAMTLFSID